MAAGDQPGGWQSEGALALTDIPLNKMPRQSEGGTLIGATLFSHIYLFCARVKTSSVNPI